MLTNTQAGQSKTKELTNHRDDTGNNKNGEVALLKLEIADSHKGQIGTGVGQGVQRAGSHCDQAVELLGIDAHAEEMLSQKLTPNLDTAGGGSRNGADDIHRDDCGQQRGAANTSSKIQEILESRHHLDRPGKSNDCGTVCNGNQCVGSTLIDSL